MGAFTIRLAKVCCPKCQHKFTVRDRGELSKKDADLIWRGFYRAFREMDKAFKTLNRIWK